METVQAKGVKQAYTTAGNGGKDRGQKQAKWKRKDARRGARRFTLQTWMHTRKLRSGQKIVKASKNDYEGGRQLLCQRKFIWGMKCEIYESKKKLGRRVERKEETRKLERTVRKVQKGIRKTEWSRDISKHVSTRLLSRKKKWNERWIKMEKLPGTKLISFLGIYWKDFNSKGKCLYNIILHC